MTTSDKKIKVWLVTVDMGYGHQRASYPLKHLAYQGVINANTYKGIIKQDKEAWLNQRKAYEAISRFKRVPVIGDMVFGLMDWLQEIPKFYPKRDLSKPTIQLLSATYFMKYKHWGKHLIDKLAQKPLPFVTSFFATAIMAEIHGYPGEIYCVICDADISRAWVSVSPRKSRIKYFAPNLRVVERLQLYGVPKSNIFFTGFPLPNENLGYPSFKTLKSDLKYRLLNLDPQRKYISKYKETLLKRLDIKSFPKKSNHPLTITFAVGGAGAQRELGVAIIKGLKENIKSGQIKVNLIAGIHAPVRDYFKENLKKFQLGNCQNCFILYEKNKQEYFKKFNEILRTTDVLWTKPSELSFYCGLGLPIVIAPPIGSQEDFNQKWLINIGAGINQEDPKYVNEWFMDWIESGRLAEAASQGFLEAPKMGTFNIEKILAKEAGKAKKIKTISQY